MSTPTWLKRASAICVATVRCQISVYRRSWSRSSDAATRAGVPAAREVGRIASWASCALRERVLYRRGSRERVPVPVLVAHELGDLAQRGLGDVDRVGPHVRDEADRPLARRSTPSYRRWAIVIVLRAPKPSLRAASCCSVEVVNGGARRALALLPLDLRDPVVGLAEPFDVGGRLGLGRQHEALLVRRWRRACPRGPRRAAARNGCSSLLRRQPDVDAPVLDRREASDLALALDDQAERDRLDAAGRQAGLDPPPQQRGDLVADEPVEDPARLLGVEQLQVDLARVLRRPRGSRRA